MYVPARAASFTQLLRAVPAAISAPAVTRAKATPAARQVPVQVKIYAALVTGLAALVLLAWPQMFPTSERFAPRVAESPWTLPLVFASLNALAILFPIHLARSSKLVLDSAAHLASLLLFGPVTAMLMAGLGSAVGNVTLMAAGKR